MIGLFVRVGGKKTAKSLTLASAIAIALFHAVAANAQTGHAPAQQLRAEVQPAMQADVKTEVSGRIQKLHVHLGERVKAGDLLAEIEANSLEDHPAKSRIFAPRDGVIRALPVVERQMVFAPGSDSGTTLMTIDDWSKLIVQIHVPEQDLARFALRQNVEVIPDALPNETQEAVISFIAPLPTVREGVKGFNVQALIEKPSAAWRPGMAIHLTTPQITLKPR